VTGKALQACTIATSSQWAQARVLVESYIRHHAGGQVTVLLLDGAHEDLPPLGAGAEVVDPEWLRMDEGEFLQMAAFYDREELAGALKPVLLNRLLDGGAVLYLDPDVQVFGPLDDLGRLALETGLVLTPQVLAPMAADGRRPEEMDFLTTGLFELGCLAVGKGARPFLDWWQERLRRGSRREPWAGLFADRRWADLASIFFQPHVLRHPGYNVGFWNLHERPLQEREGEWLVADQPLCCFHFSGFDPGRPELLTTSIGESPRCLLSESPSLSRLCAAYAERLRAAGWDAVRHTPYRFARLPDGRLYDRYMRRAYREALLASDRGSEPVPPNPLHPHSVEAFFSWLREPAAPGVLPAKVSRYLRAVWMERPDVRDAFSPPLGMDAQAFLHWAAVDPAFATEAPAELRPSPEDEAPASAGTGEEASGVNVAGYFHGELGIGQVARLLVDALEEAAIPFACLSYRSSYTRQEHPFLHAQASTFPYDVSVACVNADHLPTFVRDAGNRFGGRHRIGLWFWEVEEFLPSMDPAFEYVDEVWVGSEFTRQAVVARSPRPVFVFPVPVPVPEASLPVDPAHFGIPQGFSFLFCFDFLSGFERKNPLGLIEAFGRAFRPDEGACLVIKTINGHHRVVAREQLRLAAAPRPDVKLIEDYLAPDEVGALVQACDSYVSLHRSEGFGLTMAEAMAREKPVVATAYSGNLSFMHTGNAFLVPYRLVKIGPGCDPYPASARWADPHLDVASALLREVFDDRREAAARALRAREEMATRHSVQRSARFVANRLAAIRGGSTRQDPDLRQSPRLSTTRFT
jgi:glycosyltransferase involved in cell wall biosynthesis